jgi:hypothetical protein
MGTGQFLRTENTSPASLEPPKEGERFSELFTRFGHWFIQLRLYDEA